MTRDDPAIYAWFLHREMLDSLLPNQPARPWTRLSQAARLRTGDHNTYADELERWLRAHDVPALDLTVASGTCKVGAIVWTELDFQWSDVAHERSHATRGEDIRSTFHATIETNAQTTDVHGSFNPARLTCSTANVELRGVRRQFLLAHVAAIEPNSVELRPIAIATRLLGPPGRRWVEEDWQHVKPTEIDQFAAANWQQHVTTRDLTVLKNLPEAKVKAALAKILGEPVVPKDWGGEQSDLWTPTLRIAGTRVTAAFLLKGPARFAPMTIAMLGKNGDQIERLARTTAELLVVQHCHEIRPEVFSMLRSVASNFRDIRRYMLIDGYDTYRILAAFGHLPTPPTGR